eukprot:PhM_4_TR16085/c2_g1_i1/m.38487
MSCITLHPLRVASSSLLISICTPPRGTSTPQYSIPMMTTPLPLSNGPPATASALPTTASLQRGQVCTKGLTRSSPDVTLTRGIDCTDWKSVPTSLSDHNVITFRASDVISPPQWLQRERFNFTKADWTAYRQRLHDAVVHYAGTTDVNKDIAFLTEAIHRAARQSVRYGNRDLQGSATPWTTELDKRARALDAAKQRLIEQPTPESHAQFLMDRAALVSDIREATKKRLIESINKMKPSDSKMWTFLRSRKTAPAHRLRPPLRYGSVTATTNKERCNMLAKFYARHNPKCKRPGRINIGNTHHDPITNCEFDAALSRLSTNRAAGPDGLHAEMLRNLPRCARTLLHHICDTSLRLGRVPHSLKQAEIVALPKARKDPTLVESYRPISLTSVVAKLMEHIILTRVRHNWVPSSKQFTCRADVQMTRSSSFMTLSNRTSIDLTDGFIASRLASPSLATVATARSQCSSTSPQRSTPHRPTSKA